MIDKTTRTYSAVTRTQGANAALKDGTVRPHGATLAFTEVPVLIDAFRRMVRGNEFDVCELAITTYITAKHFGKPFTALPIFIVRGFHHGGILVNANAGIAHPKDLEGRRVGVNRGYTVTSGVWSRAVLETEYGVDCDRVTWVLSGDEHVAEYVAPPNVVPVPAGKSVAEMLIAGELAAAIGVEVDHPDVRPLIPDARAAGLRALRERGEYPINHLIVVRDEVLAADPGLAPALFDGFVRAKAPYLERLRAGTIANPTPIDALHRDVMDVIGDPLPHGIAPNRGVLERLIAHAVSQRIIPAPVDVDALFVPATRELVG